MVERDRSPEESRPYPNRREPTRWEEVPPGPGSVLLEGVTDDELCLERLSLEPGRGEPGTGERIDEPRGGRRARSATVMGLPHRGDPADDFPFRTSEFEIRRRGHVIHQAWSLEGVVQLAAGSRQACGAGSTQQPTGAVHLAGSTVGKQESERRGHAPPGIPALACGDLARVERWTPSHRRFGNVDAKVDEVRAADWGSLIGRRDERRALQLGDHPPVEPRDGPRDLA